MQLSSVSIDILLLHLVPLLKQCDVRSLAQCNRSLSVILSPALFRECSVRKNGGYFRMNLSRSTIRTIHHLWLNGSNTEHDDVFGCRDLAGVRSATIVTPILPRQRFAFGIWARRLEQLSEGFVKEGEEPISCMKNIPAGCLQQVRRLRLEVSIPVGMERMLRIARNLECIRFMPAAVRDDQGYTNYLEQLNNLMTLLHDRELLPALKIVHVAPSYVSERGHKIRHQEMRKNVWAAALSHGGWRLQSDIPSTELTVPFPAAWRWWWGTRGLGFTITLKEARQFVSMCEERNIYPQIEHYVKGPIHIQTGGGTPKIGTLPGAAIHGVWIHHGRSTNITAALRLVTSDTKILAICLNCYWGSGGSLTPDSRPFKNVEGLMFDGPMPSHNMAAFRYSDNLCASFIKGIQLVDWTRIVNLSLPALAFQHQPVDGVSFPTSCGLHIAGYNMDVLEALHTLKALSITQWLSCTECDLHPDVSFESALTSIPENVEYVALSGRFGYWGEQIPPSIKQHASDLRWILRENREDVMVNCEELYLVRLLTDEEREEMQALADLIALQAAEDAEAAIEGVEEE